MPNGYDAVVAEIAKGRRKKEPKSLMERMDESKRSGVVTPGQWLHDEFPDGARVNGRVYRENPAANKRTSYKHRFL